VSNQGFGNRLVFAVEALVAFTLPVYGQFEASVGKEFLDFARKELGSA
jgi:hypothetical protein